MSKRSREKADQLEGAIVSIPGFFWDSYMGMLLLGVLHSWFRNVPALSYVDTMLVYWLGKNVVQGLVGTDTITLTLGHIKKRLSD